MQQSIARIQEACQAPPMSPHEYRLLFEVMAKEISENDLIGAQTLANITHRAQERGLEVRRDDVRFMLEVVSEADPWFEQGASANLFAGRFRNFVVARCRGQGLNLSADELDLIDAWFAGGNMPAAGSRRRAQAARCRDAPGLPQHRPPPPAAQRWTHNAVRRPSACRRPRQPPRPQSAGGRWWANEAGAGEAGNARTHRGRTGAAGRRQRARAGRGVSPLCRNRLRG